MPGAHPPRRNERGTTLIEVLVTSVVVILIATGTLAAIDGAQRTSTNNRARSVAANLAEQDQERLRAIRVLDLSNYFETRTVPVNGVNYNVVSDSVWIRDANGNPVSCSNASTQADYMRISSTVTSPTVGSRIKPVQIRSLVAAPVGSFGPNQGTLAVEVKGRNGLGQQGVPVTIVGPQPDASATNELGCAVFAYIAVGSYTATLNSAGWVDPSGSQVVNAPGTVTAGNVNTTPPQQYDQAATIDVSFDTVVDSNPPQASSSTVVSVANSGVPNGGVRKFTSATPSSTIRAGSLYPFSSGYAVYSGSCSASDPATYVADYYLTYPGKVNVDPAGAYTVTVRQPAINTRVRLNGTDYANAHVHVRSTDAGCADFFEATTDAQGALVAPGKPFGNFTVCADNSPSSGSPRRVVKNVANIDPDGTARVDLDIVTTGPAAGLSTAGVCP